MTTSLFEPKKFLHMTLNDLCYVKNKEKEVPRAASHESNKTNFFSKFQDEYSISNSQQSRKSSVRKIKKRKTNKSIKKKSQDNSSNNSNKKDYRDKTTLNMSSSVNTWNKINKYNTSNKYHQTYIPIQSCQAMNNVTLPSPVKNNPDDSVPNLPYPQSFQNQNYSIRMTQRFTQNESSYPGIMNTKNNLNKNLQISKNSEFSIFDHNNIKSRSSNQNSFLISHSNYNVENSLSQNQ
jgi:hypothetical protein